MKKLAALFLSTVCPELRRRVSCQLSIVFFALLFSLFVSPLPSHAASTCVVDANEKLTDQELINRLNKCAIETNSFDDKIFNLNQISGTLDSLNTLLTGTSSLHPATDQVTQGSGALASSGRLISFLYSAPPASGVDYFAKQIQKFNPIQPAYAQTGIGYDALKPVQGLWTEFRNASYIGFVIIFVVIGFMVMFRAHISPQAVATVQDSLPRLVIALILVTFSYAIAGLMIDAMFLGLNIAITLLGLSANADRIFKESFTGLIFSTFWNTAIQVGDALQNIIVQIVDIQHLSEIIGFLGGNVSKAIAAIAMLFILFRVFFMLLMAYVMIIILTIAAPFFFLIQALPGRNAAGAWFRQIGGHVSTFAVVGIMILLAAKIGGYTELGGPTDSLLKDKSTQFPLLAGGLAIPDIGKLIAFGFLLMTPGAAQMVKEWLGIKGGGAFGGAAAGAAVGGALGAGASSLGRPLGVPFAPAKYAFQTKGLKGLGEMIPFRKPPAATGETAPDQRRPGQPGPSR